MAKRLVVYLARRPWGIRLTQTVLVVTKVNPSWLPTLGPSLSTYSKPLKVEAAAKAGKIAVVPRFGPYDWELPMTTIDK